MFDHTERSRKIKSRIFPPLSVSKARFIVYTSSIVLGIFNWIAAALDLQCCFGFPFTITIFYMRNSAIVDGNEFNCNAEESICSNWPVTSFMSHIIISFTFRFSWLSLHVAKHVLSFYFQFACVFFRLFFADVDRGEILGLCRRNLERNKKFYQSSDVKVAALDWCNVDSWSDRESCEKADIIIAADGN